jgi:ethanolamine ammonia-lyase large subunit
MLNYQSTSFHDALYVRNLLGLKPAPEFEEWLVRMQIWDAEKNQLCPQTSKLIMKGLLSLPNGTFEE